MWVQPGVQHCVPQHGTATMAMNEHPCKLLRATPRHAQKEASEVFFSVTKLFQNKDTGLRRMMYLCIKDICPSADEVIIVTSSLMKDMNSKVDLYRSNSVRVLCKIIDSQLLMQVRSLSCKAWHGACGAALEQQPHCSWNPVHTQCTGGEGACTERAMGTPAHACSVAHSPLPPGCVSCVD